MNRGLSAWLVLLGIACAVYAPLFGGFWIGDDFSNLHLAWLHAARSELASAMLGFFGASLTPEGAFYRGPSRAHRRRCRLESRAAHPALAWPPAAEALGAP